jgi:hypothetical protein
MVPSPAMSRLIEAILVRFRGHVQAILFYGSCRRTGSEHEGLVDLYVLVDDYRAVYSGPMTAAMNRLLPPNVFYLERPWEGRRIRAKYAVLTLADFGRGTSPRWFHSYLWGRFSQPAGLAYARDPASEAAVSEALACAVMTFIARVLPCLPASFSSRELWRCGLNLSYRAELRSERADGQVRLYDAAPDDFDAVTRAAVPALPWPVILAEGVGGVGFRADIPGLARRWCRAGWHLRIVQGKVLSVLRLVKGMVTFSGGVDYALWKIERHTGVTAAVAPRLRRFPLLAVGVLAWRIYRRGGFR